MIISRSRGSDAFDWPYHNGVAAIAVIASRCIQMTTSVVHTTVYRSICNTPGLQPGVPQHAVSEARVCTSRGDPESGHEDATCRAQNSGHAQIPPIDYLRQQEAVNPCFLSASKVFYIGFMRCACALLWGADKTLLLRPCRWTYVHRLIRVHVQARCCRYSDQRCSQLDRAAGIRMQESKHKSAHTTGGGGQC